MYILLSVNQCKSSIHIQIGKLEDFYWLKKGHFKIYTTSYTKKSSEFEPNQSRGFGLHVSRLADGT